MTSPKPDGRRLRAVRTRAAIVTALYDLVREGHLAPTAAQIAARAGVALRSIGQHFPSREALLAAVAEHHTAQVTTPVRATGSLAARLDTFVHARADELERTAPLRRAIALSPSPAEAVLVAQRRDHLRRRDELAAAFAPELDGLASDARRATLDRLYVVSSGASWDTLRTHTSLSARAAAEAMRALLTAVLAQGVPRTSASSTSRVSKRNGLRRKPAASAAAARSRS